MNNSPKRLYIYAEPTAATLDLSQLSEYLRVTLPFFDPELRPDFLQTHLSSAYEGNTEKALSQVAEQMARAKVRNPAKPYQNFQPLPGEVNYERRRLASGGGKTFGLLYDGVRLAHILRRLIPQEERNLNHIHIVFTNQLFGTWEEGDQRYHARVSIYAFPSLISTTGLVEAPAKPREYYFLKQQYTALGMPDAAAIGLEPQFRGRFIQHDDPQLTEVMKGYVMQAILYHLTGEPFCQDRGCRLYNAHWQEEVIHAQLESDYEFCPTHQSLLQELRTSTVG